MSMVEHEKGNPSVYGYDKSTAKKLAQPVGGDSGQRDSGIVIMIANGNHLEGTKHSKKESVYAEHYTGTCT
jgi:hypothetical protein